ncbi:hypothetical protein [Flammeovirga aprica]|uniref:Lipocalin-like domain-containing protein n=1 Tax=Flammeovirga aprica JL-4 TaxID=694437 RepID=A0A7X9RVB5_9BACT|nr:hypothetical protein [Flammeovirga aprica]NME69367.1 hypothetical protein [Flammeovirga aprica JL-4]
MSDFKIPNFLYLFILLFFIGCEDEEVSPNELKNYNGEYYGQTYNSAKVHIADWYIKVENGKLSGKFREMDDYEEYEGSVDQNGILTAVAIFDESSMRQSELLVITMKGTISLEDKTLKGHWINQKEDTGTFEGVKVK